MPAPLHPPVPVVPQLIPLGGRLRRPAPLGAPAPALPQQCPNPRRSASAPTVAAAPAHPQHPHGRPLGQPHRVAHAHVSHWKSKPPWRILPPSRPHPLIRPCQRTPPASRPPPNPHPERAPMRPPGRYRGYGPIRPAQPPSPATAFRQAPPVREKNAMTRPGNDRHPHNSPHAAARLPRPRWSLPPLRQSLGDN